MKKKKTDFAVIIYICLAALLILGIKYFDQIAGVALKLWNVAFPLILGCLLYTSRFCKDQAEKYH